MARILGAIASSHTPTIGFAFDAKKDQDPVWQPIFEAYRPIRDWLAERKPDVMVVIYNDHVTSFFFDHYSAFCLGVAERYGVADEGGGPRPLPPIEGHAGLSRHIGASLMADEFDMSFFQDRPLDHGCFSPLSMLLPHDRGWPTRIVPLQVGVLQFPIPTALRCYKLGHALRAAIESYPENLSVVILATGGLSHQVHGERCGFNNTAWDERFLELIETDPLALTRLTHADYARLGGMESSEVIMWLIMRGALPERVRKLHGSYYLPSMTAIATALFEPEAGSATSGNSEAQREKAGRQLAGVEALDGTYPFDLQRSVGAYRINRYLHGLVDPERRALFLADPEASFADAELSETERDLVQRRDWRGLMHYGAIFFVLEKLGAVLGIPNLQIYAAMRGETLDAFQQSRNAQILYGVTSAAAPTVE